MMKNLSIDLETYSSADISKSGLYRYCEAPDFEILLFAYSADGAPVQSVDLACGETLPKEIRAALEDPCVTKWAFNASFERICLSRWLGLPSGTYLDPSQWRCSMVWSDTMPISTCKASFSASSSAVSVRCWRADTIFLSALHAHEGERRAHAQPS